ncbi:LacI family DNA-binding transcriptional regulator [Stackebrandtia nassauensis]|uniref:LacI family DNA-binding transcriptional regulator n=1 Tax=Stackebrandtia nassauensis TaxID=283811 RepID=UPI000321DB29|nr:LacI family DNA-binding transcriptional regulator [Stackebrandtia nassauensis]
MAEQAGVSMMTVSNVVNGNHARVSQETIGRVRRIAAELGYIPNASARSLAARSSRMIGLLIPAADSDSLTISPHNMAILGQIERALRKRDYHLLLRGIADPEEVTAALKSWDLDGAILLGFHEAELARISGPAVDAARVLAIDGYTQGPLISGVRSDDFAGARLAADHLLELGHRAIVFTGPPPAPSGVVRQRLDGFRQAFADHGSTWDETLLEPVDTNTHEHGRRLGLRLRADHPEVTAVFATADILAIGIMEGLAESGAAVPTDVSVVGFDDLDLCRYVTPKLTTIAQDITAKADTAVELLLRSIESEEHADQPVTLDVHLVRRDSTAPPR